MGLRRKLGGLRRRVASRTVGCRHLLEGLASYLPGRSEPIVRGLRGTTSARSSYSVWLRHLVMAHKYGLDSDPRIVAELGPGESLGVGLAALISGCDEYFAFDVVEHSGIEKCVSVFEELVTLFQERAPIPGRDEFPEVKPYLDRYDFPHDILTDKRLGRALDKARLDRIRDSIVSQADSSMIHYMVPWNGVEVLEAGSVDMILSQAVLEHVDDLRGAYRAMYAWLKPSGFISHQVDFRSHGTASEWNGHWRYPEWVWGLIRGRRAYLLNREPDSVHLAMLQQEGFQLVCNQRVEQLSRYQASDLAKRFRSLTAEDLVTSGAFILARKLV